MIRMTHTPSSSLLRDNTSAQANNMSMPDLKDILMKRLTWTLIFAYTLFMFRPVVPVVMDALAHTFWEQQHMLVVHEVNGKFHVHNELISISHPSEKDKQSLTAKFQGYEYIPVMRGMIRAFSASAFIQVLYPYYLCLFLPSHSDFDAPPPKS